MKNRRLHYDSNLITIQPCPYIDLTNINHQLRSKHYLIDIKYLNNKLTTHIDKKGKAFKIKGFRWVFSQKSFYNNLQNNFITLSQLREINRCLQAINNHNESIKLDNLAKFINNGIKTKFLERQRYILNTKRSNGLLGSIVRYGLSEGMVKTVKGFKKGSENPAFKHNGKYSSGSKNFIHYANISEEQKQKKIDKVHQKIGLSNKQNGNNKRTIAYWLKETNGDVGLAKAMLSEHQVHFSITKAIDMLGEEEAYLKAKHIADKKRETFYSKPLEQQDKINIKRGTGSIGWWSNTSFIFNKRYNYDDINGIIYKFQCTIDNIDYWKVGITKNEFNKRFNLNIQHKYNFRNVYIMNDTIKNCFYKEQKILEYYKKYRVKTKLGTEFFNIEFVL